MNREQWTSAIEAVAKTMEENRDQLIALDAQNGDGDLGISMANGFRAAAEYLKTCEETDLGRTLNKMADAFNEAAPSSLGTIFAFLFKGMARALKGQEDADILGWGNAALQGLENITAKAGSRCGEKTILDSLYPGTKALIAHAQEGPAAAITAAAEAAEEGSEATRNMRAVWGRAAYFGDQSIGVLDGGSVAGKLVFQSLAEWVKKQN